MANPRGQQRDKPFRDALRMEAIALETEPEPLAHKKGSLRWNAQQLLLTGDTQSIREIGDRLDGKPAQSHTGDDGDDPIRHHHVVEQHIIDPKN